MAGSRAHRADRPTRGHAPTIADSVPGMEAAATFVPVRAVDVSSTGVRDAVRRGEDPADFVPDGVARLIRARGLYRG